MEPLPPSVYTAQYSVSNEDMTHVSRRFQAYLRAAQRATTALYQKQGRRPFTEGEHRAVYSALHLDQQTIAVAQTSMHRTAIFKVFFRVYTRFYHHLLAFHPQVADVIRAGSFKFLDWGWIAHQFALRFDDVFNVQRMQRFMDAIGVLSAPGSISIDMVWPPNDTMDTFDLATAMTVTYPLIPSTIWYLTEWMRLSKDYRGAVQRLHGMMQRLKETVHDDLTEAISKRHKRDPAVLAKILVRDQLATVPPKFIAAAVLVVSSGLPRVARACVHQLQKAMERSSHALAVYLDVAYYFGYLQPSLLSARQIPTIGNDDDDVAIQELSDRALFHAKAPSNTPFAFLWNNRHAQAQPLLATHIMHMTVQHANTTAPILPEDDYVEFLRTVFDAATRQHVKKQFTQEDLADLLHVTLALTSRVYRTGRQSERASTAAIPYFIVGLVLQGLVHHTGPNRGGPLVFSPSQMSKPFPAEYAAHATVRASQTLVQHYVGQIQTDFKGASVPAFLRSFIGADLERPSPFTLVTSRREEQAETMHDLFRETRSVPVPSAQPWSSTPAAAHPPGVTVPPRGLPAPPPPVRRRDKRQEMIAIDNSSSNDDDDDDDDEDVPSRVITPSPPRASRRSRRRVRAPVRLEDDQAFSLDIPAPTHPSAIGTGVTSAPTRKRRDVRFETSRAAFNDYFRQLDACSTLCRQKNLFAQNSVRSSTIALRQLPPRIGPARPPTLQQNVRRTLGHIIASQLNQFMAAAKQSVLENKWDQLILDLPTLPPINLHEPIFREFPSFNRVRTWLIINHTIIPERWETSMYLVLNEFYRLAATASWSANTKMRRLAVHLAKYLQRHHDPPMEEPDMHALDIVYFMWTRDQIDLVQQMVEHERNGESDRAASIVQRRRDVRSLVHDESAWNALLFHFISDSVSLSVENEEATLRVLVSFANKSPTYLA